MRWIKAEKSCRSVTVDVGPPLRFDCVPAYC